MFGEGGANHWEELWGSVWLQVFLLKSLKSSWKIKKTRKAGGLPIWNWLLWMKPKGSSYKLSSHSPDHLHLFSIHLPKKNQFLGWKQIIRFIYDYFITFNQMFLYFILLLLHKVLLGTIFFTVLSNLIYSLGGVWKEVSIQIKFGSDLYWELQATLV